MELAEYQNVANVEDDHWWFRSTRRLISEMLAPWWKPGIRVLDAGCGPGGNGARLLRYGTVVGLDFEYAAVEFVRDRRAPMGPVQGSVTALPFPDNSFDVIIDVTVLYHVPDDALAAREIGRVLKPGGAVFAVEPALELFRRAHDAQGHTARRYSLDRLAQIFRDGGLTIERATYAKSFLAAPAFALGLLQRAQRTAAEDARSDLAPRPTDWITDPVFDRLASAEDRRILAGGSMPFGTSAIVVGVKD
ncbi:MAG: methyltransferase domain-containing protein [Acidimicrobiia bacterium]